VKALVTGMSDSIDKQMAYVYFLFNFGGAIIFSFLVDPFHRFLTHFWPATEEENKSKVKYIYDQALQEPETAMDVAEKEQERLTEFISDHFAWIRNAVSSGALER
jgi:phosphate:Na+ symporter